MLDNITANRRKTCNVPCTKQCEAKQVKASFPKRGPLLGALHGHTEMLTRAAPDFCANPRSPMYNNIALILYNMSLYTALYLQCTMGATNFI